MPFSTDQRKSSAYLNTYRVNLLGTQETVNQSRFTLNEQILRSLFLSRTTFSSIRFLCRLYRIADLLSSVRKCGEVEPPNAKGPYVNPTATATKKQTGLTNISRTRTLFGSFEKRTHVSYPAMYKTLGVLSKYGVLIE